jgi:surface antigen
MTRTAVACLLLVAAGVSTTALADNERGRPGRDRHDDRDGHYNRHDRAGRAYFVPPGHMPPPGMCRVWYPDRPPGHQPPPGPCNVLIVRLPRDAELIRGGNYAPPPPPRERVTAIDAGACNRALVGGLVGGVAGAVIGNQFGKGDGRTAATIGGAVLGMLIGGTIGNGMDQADQGCVGQTLDHARDNEQIVWNNPSNGARYQVMPVKTVAAEGDRYCREYITRVTIGGKQEQAYGRACRQPDGSWQTMN